jgi:SAM-dependent methyltransferase
VNWLDAAFERPPCPLCGATRAKLQVLAADRWLREEARRFAVLRCEVCSTRYTSPRYRKEMRHLAYGPDYPYYLRAREGRPVDRALAVRPFEGRASRLIALESTGGRLLDLGCGDGYFMDLMRTRGWDVVGADIEPSVVRYAADVLGLDCRELDVESDPLPAGPFEAVTLWGSLQLMYRPQRLLENIRDLLAPGGVVAIGVSNIKSAGALVFGRYWHGLGVPRHLVHFTPETLVRLLEWSGFRVVAKAFETPRWITSGSIDDIGLDSGAQRRAAKAATAAFGALSGRTRFGDTMEVYARLTSSAGGRARRGRGSTDHRGP